MQIASDVETITVTSKWERWRLKSPASPLFTQASSSASLAICARNSPGTGEFPAQMASNAGNFSLWWRHHTYEIHLGWWSLPSVYRTPEQDLYPTPDWSAKYTTKTPWHRNVICLWNLLVTTHERPIIHESGMDVLPQDLMKSRRRGIQVWIFPIGLEFARHLCSRAAQMPGNFIAIRPLYYPIP